MAAASSSSADAHRSLPSTARIDERLNSLGAVISDAHRAAYGVASMSDERRLFDVAQCDNPRHGAERAALSRVEVIASWLCARLDQADVTHEPANDDLEWRTTAVRMFGVLVALRDGTVATDDRRRHHHHDGDQPPLDPYAFNTRLCLRAVRAAVVGLEDAYTIAEVTRVTSCYYGVAILPRVPERRVDEALELRFVVAAGAAAAAMTNESQTAPQRRRRRLIIRLEAPSNAAARMHKASVASQIDAWFETSAASLGAAPVRIIEWLYGADGDDVNATPLDREWASLVAWLFRERFGCFVRAWRCASPAAAAAHSEEK